MSTDNLISHIANRDNRTPDIMKEIEQKLFNKLKWFKRQSHLLTKERKQMRDRQIETLAVIYSEMSLCY